MDISDITLIITTGFIASTSLITLVVSLCSSNNILSRQDKNNNYSDQLYSVVSEDNLEDGLEDGLEDSLKDGLEDSLKDSLEDGLEDSLKDSLESYENFVSEDSKDELVSDEINNDNLNTNSFKNSMERLDNGIKILQNNQINLDKFINDRVTYLEMEQEKLIDFIYEANIDNQKRLAFFKNLLIQIKQEFNKFK